MLKQQLYSLSIVWCSTDLNILIYEYEWTPLQDVMMADGRDSRKRKEHMTGHAHCWTLEYPVSSSLRKKADKLNFCSMLSSNETTLPLELIEYEVSLYPRISKNQFWLNAEDEDLARAIEHVANK